MSKCSCHDAAPAPTTVITHRTLTHVCGLRGVRPYLPVVLIPNSLHQALPALQVAETSQETRQLRERVADLTATNSVLVASIPNLSQRYKCARPSACSILRPSSSCHPLNPRGNRAASVVHRAPCMQCTRRATQF